MRHAAVRLRSLLPISLRCDTARTIAHTSSTVFSRGVHGAHSSRNATARARYASMDPGKKSALLARNRERSALSRAKKIFPVQGVSPFLGQFDRLKHIYQAPWYLPAQEPCNHCGAYRFYGESAGFCCGSGQVFLPKTVICPIMWFLFTDAVSELAIEFRRRVRSYNGAFAFTSIGMKIDENSWWARDGIYALKVVGQVHHSMNHVDGFPDLSKMLQLFFLDTADNLPETSLQKKDFRRDIMTLIIDVLATNPYASFFKRLRTWEDLSDAYIVLRSNSVLDQRNYNLPTTDQVAAVWKDGDESCGGLERDIRVFTQAGLSRKIRIEKLHLPHKYSAGACRPVCDGLNVAAATDVNSADHLLLLEDEVLQQNKRNRSNVSCRQYYCYKAQMRDGDYSCLLHAGRLGQQYVIDMYIKVETSRLDYYRSEQVQKELRTESFQGIVDSLHIDGDIGPSDIGQRLVLPSSFIGGPRDMRKRYVNAMALVQKFGKPDLFITMTCNPAWKEITDLLLPGQKADDRPDLVARVFHAKLQELKDDIVKKKIFGPVAAYVYAIEQQKRGLPHCHWVIILQDGHHITSPEMYDQIISAELPNASNPFLREYVIRHMMHGPCGQSNPKNVCMRDGQCKNHYPKDFSAETINGPNGYALYRRRDDGERVLVRKVLLDNRNVVPYCPYLLAKFDCHINVEICADIKLVKYLYKYIHKGHDKIAYNVVPDASFDVRDEIQAYQNGRWICAPEAYWRIYGFLMGEMSPPVVVMPVHLPNHQPLRFGVHQSLQQVLRNPFSCKTMLTEFFNANRCDESAMRLRLLYKEFPEYFVWEAGKRKWKIRQKQHVVGRLCTVNPLEGERYFERLLLLNVRCPTSFEDLLTFNGHTYFTFREAATARGLLQSDEYIDTCLAEACLFQTSSSLRLLFALLLVYGVTGDVQILWDKYFSSLSGDFAHSGLLTTAQVIRKTVSDIDFVLNSMNRSITDFPIRFSCECPLADDRLSMDYKYECSIGVSAEDMISIGCLNTDQQSAFSQIIAQLDIGGHGVFFIDGPGGTGKTFLYRSLLAYVRSKGGIALAVASSGVAAALLPGGRTAHSRFKLPFDVDDVDIGKVSKQSSLARMIREAKLIIWDEAPMANRHSVEAFELLLSDLCDSSLPFGGKIVLFGGDFRQTLPIVVGGSRDSMIAASMVSSTLWQDIIRLRLSENMRAKEDPIFSEFLLRIGNGVEPFLFDDNIKLPSNMLVPFVDEATSLDCLINDVYPNLDTFVQNPLSFINRGLLTTKNDCVDELNDLLIERFPGQMKEYVSFNRTTDPLQQGEYEDFLSTVSPSGLPPNMLRLKENCPIMLLRNLNPVQGLCNGTRLICRELGENFIRAEIAVGDFKGVTVFIPRIPLETPSQLKCPISFKRMQIPVRLCFAMTINKSQGQTLDFVGIYLKEPVFSHGQLYVALSRAKSAAAVRVLIHPGSRCKRVVDYTRNIVFHEIFRLLNGVDNTS
ncbi:hypothetical protein ABFX02_07G104800 [Erythranthe guttata]